MSRAERRRRQREEAKRASSPPASGSRPRLLVGRDIFADGIVPGSPEAAIIEDQAGETVARLRVDPSMSATIELAAGAAAALDRRLSELPPPPRALACGRGCAHCCHLKVNAGIPEVFRIAQHLLTRMSASTCDAVRLAVETHRDHTRPLRGDARMMARQPCPLLADGCCVAYPVRPLTCRGWNSFDVALCEADHRSPGRGSLASVFSHQLQSARSLLAGQEAGLALLRLECESIDLAEGLRIALGKDLVPLHRAWRAGEPVFTAAEDDEATREAADRWTRLVPEGEANPGNRVGTESGSLPDPE